MATARPLRERIRAWRRSLQDPLRGGGAAASWVASLPTGDPLQLQHEVLDLIASFPGGRRRIGPAQAEALLRRMGRGLLVTELLGQGVNPVTGDYSRGAAGYWVENGVIAYPVEEITIAGNLRRMYRDIVAVGNDVDRRGSRHCGSILIGAMMVAGN